MNAVKNSTIASTIGTVDMAALSERANWWLLGARTGNRFTAVRWPMC